jgi:hypothetical protein
MYQISKKAYNSISKSQISRVINKILIFRRDPIILKAWAIY